MVRMSDVRGDAMMAGVPEPVVRFQRMMQGRARFTIVRYLLDEPRTFAQLHELTELMGEATMRVALRELQEMGYVTDDGSKALSRRTNTTRFTADRALVMSDLAETMKYLSI